MKEKEAWIGFHLAPVSSTEVKLIVTAGCAALLSHNALPEPASEKERFGDMKKLISIEGWRFLVNLGLKGRIITNSKNHSLLVNLLRG